MANPKVFVSSTCYDLKYIRENIRYFIHTLGYESILSEDGDIFYNPKTHTHDSCVAEIPNCQLFILIIGGRYGGKYKDTEYSITNAEYKEAVKLKIPIFTLIEQAVYNEHLFYTKNKLNPEVDENKIIYPNVDNIKVFEFIDEVRKNSINNAFAPFRNFNDIESYLKKQWAGMMYSFLKKDNEEKKLHDTLSVISHMNEKIEMLSKQILDSVGTKKSKLIASLYEEILEHQCINDLTAWKIKPNIQLILQNDSFSKLLHEMNFNYNIISDDESYVFSGDGSISNSRFKGDSKDYVELRNKLIDMIESSGESQESLY